MKPHEGAPHAEEYYKVIASHPQDLRSFDHPNNMLSTDLRGRHTLRWAEVMSNPAAGALVSEIISHSQSRTLDSRRLPAFECPF